MASDGLLIKAGDVVVAGFKENSKISCCLSDTLIKTEIRPSPDFRR